jgi:hypothetical protein
MATQLIGPLQQRICSPKSQKRRKVKRKPQSLLRLVLTNHTWMAYRNPRMEFELFEANQQIENLHAINGVLQQQLVASQQQFVASQQQLVASQQQLGTSQRQAEEHVNALVHRIETLEQQAVVTNARLRATLPAVNPPVNPPVNLFVNPPAALIENDSTEDGTTASSSDEDMKTSTEQ